MAGRVVVKGRLVVVRIDIWRKPPQVRVAEVPADPVSNSLEVARTLLRSANVYCFRRTKDGASVEYAVRL